MRDLFADVIVDISHEALDKVFQYRVPLSLREEIKPGSRVKIPFGTGNRETEGYVIALREKPDYDPEKIKEIQETVEGSIGVESQLIAVADFMRQRYGSTMIQALRMVLPVKRKIRHQMRTRVTLLLEGEDLETLRAQWEKRHYTARLRLLDYLCRREGRAADSQELLRESRMTMKDLRKLEEQGVLRLETDISWRGNVTVEPKKNRILLNAEQQAAVDRFSEEYGRGERKTYLLYGVTGSGKTEVYLSMIEKVLEEGRQVIMLIPEISLTFQTVRRFSERFGQRIAVMHSKMSAGEKSDAVEKIRLGEVDVVIGARSALFAPVRNLGLILIDEEHDGAYKSDTSPKYHARETAIYRASLAGASVVLGSATPSVESYTRACQGEYTLLTLRQRAGAGQLPAVTAVDLREEFQLGNRSVFSTVLREKIEDRLQKKEQIMLFLNRRGFAGFVSCRSCGQVIKCPHCDVSLTYHRNGSLRCHYCGFETAYSKVCPVCHSPHVAAFGLGTEKVEAALHQEFPGVRVLRMDTDTTRRKHAHEEILSAFSRGEADILLGTQMIVKGHDYANVTLVGILAADLSMHSGDYRSAEQTFQLLCQAAGRAGRGEKAGEVIIQTYDPEHYAITSTLHHSYEEFYKEEYAYRSLMGYPPCAHLLVVLVQSGDETQAILAAQRIQKMVVQSQTEEQDPAVVMNPGQAAVAKIRDVYRQVIYIKHREEERLFNLRNRLEPVLLTHPLFAGVQIQFDFDPMTYY